MTRRQFSVIIPVFNAAQFVVRAVHSALEQPETGEVILIEDGSSDESLLVCHQLENSSERVRLFTHPNNENRGAGASRNLGISKANFSLIAFLDADDYYLSDRFKETLRILEADPDIHGVYGCCLHSFRSEALKSLYAEERDPGIMGLSGFIPFSELLDTLMGGQQGFFSIITLVVRRNILDRIGLFDDTLVQHQDTDFIWRLAKDAHLISVSSENPLAVINVHGDNRIFNKKEARAYRQKLMYKWLAISNKEVFPSKRANYIIRSFLANHWLVYGSPSNLQFLTKSFLILVYSLRFPRSFINAFFTKNRLT